MLLGRVSILQLARRSEGICETCAAIRLACNDDGEITYDEDEQIPDMMSLSNMV